MEKAREIEELIELYLTDNRKDKFTCKKELYDLFVQEGFTKLNLDDYFEMGSLYCTKTKKPKDCDGKMDTPTLVDKDILVKYWFDDSQEMNGVDPISMEQAKMDIQQMMASGHFYVWRNDAGKIVCMASYNEAGGEAKLSHAYTPVEERKKGYAANLVYAITNDILERGLVPLLYTDYNYIPSNRAYINAGYIDAGILINFSCSKVKVKELK